MILASHKFSSLITSEVPTYYQKIKEFDVFCRLSELVMGLPSKLYAWWNFVFSSFALLLAAVSVFLFVYILTFVGVNICLHEKPLFNSLTIYEKAKNSASDAFDEFLLVILFLALLSSML